MMKLLKKRIYLNQSNQTKQRIDF